MCCKVLNISPTVDIYVDLHSMPKNFNDIIIPFPISDGQEGQEEGSITPVFYIFYFLVLHKNYFKNKVKSWSDANWWKLLIYIGI